MYRPNRASTAIARNANSPPLFSNEKIIKKQRQQQYLTPRTQSFSAQSSRNQNQDVQMRSTKAQLKLQSKVPVMTSNFRQDQLKSRINKLGLESFMKQIVLPEKMADPQFSSKVIHALNRTYLQDDVQFQKNEFRSSFGKKSLRESRKFQNPKVNWNPEKDLMENQFKQFDYFIPSSMFPCRKQTTKLLKSKLKKRDQSFQYSKPREDIVTKLLQSQSNRQRVSTNLNDPKRSRPKLKTSQSERKGKSLFLLNLTQYSKSSFMRNSKDLKAENQSVYCRRARIYA